MGGPVLNGHGMSLLGGHGSALVSSTEAASIVGPSTTTPGVILLCVLTGPVLTVTGSGSMSTYSTLTLAINILANLVCLIVAVPPVDIGVAG